MNGARWGWLALIGSIAVLFAASNQESALHSKIVNPLRQELKQTVADRNQARQERDDARRLADEVQEWSTLLEARLDSADQDLRQLKAEREAMRNEIAKLSVERSQLQQTIASLHHERAQTKRNMEQIRHSLHQVLSQTEAATAALAQPAPGLVRAAATEAKTTTVLPAPTPVEIYYDDLPVSKKH